MFTGKQFGVLGVIVGANLLLSLLISNVGVSLGQQGPTGATGPQGPEGSTGVPGTNGVDGREVEFDVVNNVLVWRYVGETRWNELDLEITSGGGGSTITNTGEGFFTHWMFNTNPNLRFEYPEETTISNSATYAANLITNQGYVGVSTLADLQAMTADETAAAGKYVLTSNIDLSTWTPNSLNSEYFVIGNAFKGIFDGAGYTISNMKIDETVSSNYVQGAGLFREINSGEIHNLNLVDFEFLSSNEINSAGALAAYTYDSQEPTLFNQVTVSNFFLQSPNYNYVGGLVGYLDGNVSFVRSTVENFELEVSNYMYSTAGLFGYFDGSETIELYENSITMNVSRMNVADEPAIDRVGAVGGYIKNNTTLVAYKNQMTITTPAREYVGGFIGTMAGYSKVLIKDLQVETDITVAQPSSTNSYGIGGVFGFYGRDGLMFMDDVEVSGSITGNYDVGGMVGYGKEGSVVKITNSTTDVNVIGIERVGGVVGQIADNQQRWMFQELEVNVTLQPYFRTNTNYFYFERFGGLVGIVNERDDDKIYSSEIWVDRTDINVVFDFVISDDELESSLYVQFYDIGGVFGLLDDGNQIRITNTSVDSVLNATKTDSVNTLEFDLEVSDVGGLVGELDEDNTLMVINVESTLEFNFVVDGFEAELDFRSVNDYDAYDIGGAIGLFDEDSKAIFLESDIALYFNFVVSNFDSANVSLEISVNQVGGLIGDLDGSAELIAQGLNVLLDISIKIENNDLGDIDDTTLEIDIYDFGSLIGQADGFALFNDTTFETIISDLVLPSASLEGVFINTESLTNAIGNKNIFIFY